MKSAKANHWIVSYQLYSYLTEDKSVENQGVLHFNSPPIRLMLQMQNLFTSEIEDQEN